MCLLFLHEIRDQAQKIGKGLTKDVRSLSEELCLNAFVNEWTIARLAWIDHLSGSITNASLHLALKSKILEAVNTYNGPGKIKFDDYKWLIFEEANDAQRPPTPGSLFLSGFNERLSRIPSKSSSAPRMKLTPHEETEIMMVVIDSCWVEGFDLNSTLEAFRSKATAEIIAIA